MHVYVPRPSPPRPAVQLLTLLRAVFCCALCSDESNFGYVYGPITTRSIPHSYFVSYFEVLGVIVCPIHRVMHDHLFPLHIMLLILLRPTNTNKCGYHVPGPTHLGKMSKPLLPSRLRLWKPCSGISGDCHVWKLATEPSPHSADGSSTADISPGGFSAAGLWKAPLDGLLTRVPRE